MGDELTRVGSRDCLTLKSHALDLDNFSYVLSEIVTGSATLGYQVHFTNKDNTSAMKDR